MSTRSNSLEPCFRTEPKESDRQLIRELVAATGYFHPEEVAVAEELVEERLLKGESSGYFFSFLDDDSRLIGYVCYGPIPCTQSSFDLYWIAVHPDIFRRGFGRRLMLDAEARIRKAGGTRIYLDTSNRPQYQPTREFYLRCGYKIAAVLDEFYGPGDDKVIFQKLL